MTTAVPAFVMRGCAASAVIALVLLAPAAASAAPAGKPRHPAPERPRAASQRCPSLPSGTAIPPGPPAGLSWQRVGALPVPVAPSAGPTRRTGPAWSCYAHSPVGAVMAAFGIPAALCGPQWQAATAREVVPGPGLTAFLAAGASQRYAPPTAAVARPAGFAVVAYTSEQATVEVLVPDGRQYAASFRTLAWSGVDWRLVMLPDGTAGPGPQVLATTAGFTLWGGQ